MLQRLRWLQWLHLSVIVPKIALAQIARPHSFDCSVSCSTSALLVTLASSNVATAALVTAATPTCDCTPITLAQIARPHSFDCSVSCSTSALLVTLASSNVATAALVTAATPTCD